MKQWNSGTDETGGTAKQGETVKQSGPGAAAGGMGGAPTVKAARRQR